MNGGSKNSLCKLVIRRSLKEGKQRVRRGTTVENGIARRSLDKVVRVERQRGGVKSVTINSDRRKQSTREQSSCDLVFAWHRVRRRPGQTSGAQHPEQSSTKTEAALCPRFLYRSCTCNTDFNLHSARLHEKHSINLNSDCVIVRGVIYWVGGWMGGGGGVKTMQQNITPS